MCSGDFRVNANAKLLDVWLIYKCGRCGATWNLPVYSRVRAASLPVGLLEKFTQNDPVLCERYAFDKGLLKSCGAKLSYDSVDFNITTQPVPAGRSASVRMTCAHALDMRAGVLIRQAVSRYYGEEVSASALKRMVESGQISAAPGLLAARFNTGVGFVFTP